MKQVNGFSYTESVQKTKKKKMENCIPEVEDLFKRIFIGNPRQRISFLQIR